MKTKNGLLAEIRFFSKVRKNQDKFPFTINAGDSSEIPDFVSL